MKIVLGLLLAVNLLVFFLISQADNHSNELAAERATNMPPLRLLNEKIDTQTKNESVQSDVATSVLKQTEAKTQPSAAFFELECYSLGPFAVKDSLKAVISRLSQLGIKSVKRYETRRELSGFWVYIPPLPSRADAHKVITMLKERGVKDYLIVSSGSKKHAISLGFFHTKEGAQQHKTHMQTLGLAPIMDESYKNSSGFWLDFSSLAQPALPNQLVDDLQNQYDGISMKKRQCLQ